MKPKNKLLDKVFLVARRKERQRQAIHHFKAKWIVEFLQTRDRVCENTPSIPSFMEDHSIKTYSSAYLIKSSYECMTQRFI